MTKTEKSKTAAVLLSKNRRAQRRLEGFGGPAVSPACASPLGRPLAQSLPYPTQRARVRWVHRVVSTEAGGQVPHRVPHTRPVSSCCIGQQPVPRLPSFRAAFFAFCCFCCFFASRFTAPAEASRVQCSWDASSCRAGVGAVGDLSQSSRLTRRRKRSSSVPPCDSTRGRRWMRISLSAACRTCWG